MKNKAMTVNQVKAMARREVQERIISALEGVEMIGNKLYYPTAHTTEGQTLYVEIAVTAKDNKGTSKTAPFSIERLRAKEAEAENIAKAEAELKAKIRELKGK